MKKMADLASISPLGARGVNRGGCGGVGQDVDEVWIHVLFKQLKDVHSLWSICREGKMCHSGFPALSRNILQQLCELWKHTGIYLVKGVDVEGLWSVSVDLHHGWRGEYQYVCAGCILRGAQLRCLHVKGGASTKHGACRHWVCRDETKESAVRLKAFCKWSQTSQTLNIISFTWHNHKGTLRLHGN